MLHIKSGSGSRVRLVTALLRSALDLDLGPRAEFGVWRPCYFIYTDLKAETDKL